MTPSYHHVLTRLCQEVRQNMARKGLKDNEIEWDVDLEVLFFLAMIGHKPVGVNKHFMMLLIHHKFSSFLDHQISSKVLWDHLDTLYDMAALHESEIIPFPNEEVDFELPEDCYDLAKSKLGASFKPPNSKSEYTKSSSNSKVSKKIVTSKLKQGNIPGSSKTLFATPSLNKPIKSETKSSASNGTPKIKQELTPSVKTNKMKRSSSPFYNKIVRCESVSSKESFPDNLSNRKNKERSNSPATNKKHNKGESSLASSTSKKTSKYEALPCTSKSVKESTPDSVKKVKSEKDVSKKGKIIDNAPSANKSSKVENDGVKKKMESESVPKKTTETCMKHVKSDVKSSVLSSKVDTPPSGSRKSSQVVKAKNNDSSRKVKRPRLEEPSKKSTPGSKRRRIT